MNTSDDRNRQQGAPGSQSEVQQGTQPQQQGGGQAQQFEQRRSQQGDAAAGQRGTQQEQYSSPGRSQQGGAVTRRGGTGWPSLFGGSRGGPFELLHRLDEDMDRLFHQLWGGSRSSTRRGGDMPSTWMPQVEMCEREGKLHVFADLPGMKKEDVDVRIEGDQLVLQGERRSGVDENQQAGYFHSERSYGSFYRSIPLPDGVDPGTVDASFRDGVLEVCFDAPRPPQQQSRRIEVRDGEGTSAPRSGGIA